MLLEVVRQRKQLISITPLIDVVFILLLFFMLSSTFNRTKQIDITTALPGQQQHQQDSEIKKLFLDADGAVVIEGIRYQSDSSDFIEQLHTYAQSGDQVIVAVSADIRVQRLVKLIDQIRQSGISNLKLAKSVTS